MEYDVDSPGDEHEDEDGLEEYKHLTSANTTTVGESVSSVVTAMLDCSLLGYKLVLKYIWARKLEFGFLDLLHQHYSQLRDSVLITESPLL